MQKSPGFGNFDEGADLNPGEVFQRLLDNFLHEFDRNVSRRELRALGENLIVGCDTFLRDASADQIYSFVKIVYRYHKSLKEKTEDGDSDLAIHIISRVCGFFRRYLEEELKCEGREGAAISMLYELSDPAAIPALVAFLEESDKHPVDSCEKRLVDRIITVLGRIGDPAAIPALIDVLQDEDWLVRESAAKALGRIGDPAAIPALESALFDEREGVGVKSAVALGNIGDSAAIPALESALLGEHQSVAIQSANALGKIGDSAAIPILERITANESVSDDIKNAAHLALSRLQNDKWR